MNDRFSGIYWTVAIKVKEEEEGERVIRRMRPGCNSTLQPPCARDLRQTKSVKWRWERMTGAGQDRNHVPADAKPNGSYTWAASGDFKHGASQCVAPKRKISDED